MRIRKLARLEQMDKHAALAAQRPSRLALSLASADEARVALHRVLGLPALPTRHAVSAEGLLANIAHRLTISVLAIHLHVWADIVLVALVIDHLIKLVLHLAELSPKWTTRLALSCTLLDVLGVAVERLFLRVAHFARQALSAEILLADAADDLAVFDALHGETRADVVVVGRGEPVGEGEDARGG